MAALENNSAFIFGLVGNILSCLVYMSPLPTFYKIFKKKSTEGFQSIPYSIALFSAMLTLYYAYLKINAFMLVMINSIGCVVQSLYLFVYMIYATRGSKIFTAKLLTFFNFGAFGLILFSTYLSSEGRQRLTIVGWICAIFSVCVFAAPLSVIRLVIKTKSVKYMPFSLSFCLTICAVMWFLYGLFMDDYYIATPNILGAALGVIQMIVYFIYKRRRSEISPAVDLKEEEETWEDANGFYNINGFAMSSDNV